MAVTYRDLINRVLRATSEPEIDPLVTELNDETHQRIGQFVNLILQEVEDAINWRSLQQNLSVTVTANTNSGTITGANERSRLVRLHQASAGRIVPLVIDVTDTNNPALLKEIPRADMILRQTLETNTTSGAPAFFCIDDSSGDNMNLLVHPRPTANRSINVLMVVPQTRLEDDDLDTVIKVPTHPVELGSIWWTLFDNGEELANGGVFTEERYRLALDSAVSREEAESGGLELVVV